MNKRTWETTQSIPKALLLPDPQTRLTYAGLGRLRLVESALPRRQVSGPCGAVLLALQQCSKS
jgi:hypothetical protein